MSGVPKYTPVYSEQTKPDLVDWVSLLFLPLVALFLNTLATCPIVCSTLIAQEVAILQGTREEEPTPYPQDVAIPVDTIISYKNMAKLFRSFCHDSETPVCSYFCLFAIFGEFVRNFGWVLAILFEILLIDIQEEIHHFAGWGGGGGVTGHKNCEQKFCEQTGVS